MQWGRVGGDPAHGAARLTGRDASVWESLDGASFSMPLRAGSLRAPLRVWAIGSHQALRAPDDMLQWEGHLSGAQVGVDKELAPHVRGGLAASWSKGDFTYEDNRDGGSGSYESSFVSVHPYLGRRSANGFAWGTVGYGAGDLSIRDDGRREQSSDLILRAASTGGRRNLVTAREASWRLDVQGDAIFARVDVRGRGLVAADAVDVSRLRLALAGMKRWSFGTHSVTSDVELGGRSDGGFVGDGKGVEVGGGLAYVSRAMGLTVEGRGRAFLFGPVNEWGVQALIRIDPESDAIGPSMLVRPAWGAMSGGVHQLWSEGLSALGASTPEAAGRVTAEFGYGVSRWGGVVTPYAVYRGGATRAWRAGARYEWLDRFTVRFESERMARNGSSERAFLLHLMWVGRGVWPFASPVGVVWREPHAGSYHPTGGQPVPRASR